ncbi:MAG: 30S ribosomal protein S10 [Candidatus Nezhaarchaeota archaeon]|nr:30S ribosomal protein S10 [Candidatus Nezhaarchaeota archaeon]
MVKRARIRVSSPNLKDLQEVCTEIVNIAKKTGVRVRGPIPLPTKKLMVPVRKAPSGEGTHTFDHYELRIHKRIIDIDAEERTLRSLMRIKMPETMHIEIELV